MFLSGPIRVRLSKEAYDKLNLLLKDYPEDYQTKSSVIRSAIIHFYKWRQEK